MPELPEVETVRRGLEPVMAGGRVAEAIARRPDLRRPLPERFAARMTGRRVVALRRRSKTLLVDLDGDETLLIHLGMSGRMIIHGVVAGDFTHDASIIPAHNHVEFTMESGARVIFNDARRFGAMDLCPTPELETHPTLRDLGPEPLGNGFSPAALLTATRNRRSPLKAFLLDQRRVAGLGNIYVAEALWRARLSPFRAAGTLRGDEAAALVTAIRDTLTEAIEAGGSTLRDHRLTDGSLGYFQHRFAVYGRANEPCPACTAPVQRVTQSGRSTYFCTSCQNATAPTP